MRGCSQPRHVVRNFMCCLCFVCSLVPGIFHVFLPFFNKSLQLTTSQLWNTVLLRFFASRPDPKCSHPPLLPSQNRIALALAVNCPRWSKSPDLRWGAKTNKQTNMKVLENNNLGNESGYTPKTKHNNEKLISMTRQQGISALQPKTQIRYMIKKSLQTMGSCFDPPIVEYKFRVA